MKLQNIYAELLGHIPEIKAQDLAKTSLRASEAFEFLTSGYQVNLEQWAGSLYPCPESGQVMLKGIAFMSLCEHHLLPMIGHCHVAYQPQGQVLGLSKIAEIVEALSRRLQLQERLTHQIASSILELTQAKGVAVMMEAKHLCMAMKGVEKMDQLVRTTAFLGSMREEGTCLFL